MKRLFIGCMLLVLTLCLVSCNSGEHSSESEEDVYTLYYMNREETKIEPQEYQATKTQKDEIIEELLLKLGQEPENKNLEPVLKSNISVLNAQVEEDRLNLNFSEEYKLLSPTSEILTRAAIVRTMTQIEGIRYVTVSVNEVALNDASGQLVGMMDGTAFIDNAGSEINAYEQVKLQLYFANEAGDSLVPVSKTIKYNTNISMEKLLLEQLIIGPSGTGSYPTMSPDTKVLNVTVKDGICYINLSEEFLTSTYTVNSEVTIYSIVNTLTSLSNVNKVQFLVEGEDAEVFRENISLENAFSRNLDLIIK